MNLTITIHIAYQPHLLHLRNVYDLTKVQVLNYLEIQLYFCTRLCMDFATNKRVADYMCG